MSDLFRDVSRKRRSCSRLSKGLFGEYAARYGDYFSRDAEVELTEWYLAPQGYLSCWSGGKLSPPARINRKMPIRRKSNGSGPIVVPASSRAGGESGTELERRAVLAGYSHIYLTTGFASRKRCGSIWAGLSGAVRPQLGDPEEYSLPPFDGRLRFTKTLVAVSAR